MFRMPFSLVMILTIGVLCIFLSSAMLNGMMTFVLVSSLQVQMHCLHTGITWTPERKRKKLLHVMLKDIVAHGQSFNQSHWII